MEFYDVAITFYGSWQFTKMSGYGKMLIYKGTMKYDEIWTCGIQLRRMAAKSHVQKMESQQGKILRDLIDAAWSGEERRQTVTPAQLENRNGDIL